MGRPRILPDADVLHDLKIVQGLTYDEIAERYGVTRAAVHLALRKSGLVTPRPRYERHIPWKVAVEHSNSYHLAMLRLAARKEQGEKIPAYKEKYLENWLEALRREDLVIDYARDWAGYNQGLGGFGTVKRRPGIDNWLIREPDPEAVAS
jgi:hypothetical protein